MPRHATPARRLEVLRLAACLIGERTPTPPDGLCQERPHSPRSHGGMKGVPLSSTRLEALRDRGPGLVSTDFAFAMGAAMVEDEVWFRSPDWGLRILEKDASAIGGIEGVHGGCRVPHSARPFSHTPPSMGCRGRARLDGRMHRTREAWPSMCGKGRSWDWV